MIAKKLRPLVWYAALTVVRRQRARRLVRENANGGTHVATLGLRILGGTGDYVVMARFVRDLVAAIEPCRFDVYSNKPDIAAWAFGRIAGFRHCLHEAVFDPCAAGYTVSIQISQFAFIGDGWASPVAHREFPKLGRVVSKLAEFRLDNGSIIAEHPRLDNFLAQKAIFSNRSRADYLHHMAGLSYGGTRFNLQQAGHRTSARLAAEPYITIHNGFDEDMVTVGRRATKCYPHFGNVISRIKNAFPEIVVVQLGISTSMRLAEADVNLIGKTSLPEAAALIQGALLHIDNEGGLVHIAAALGTTSCVVFGPTSSRYFGYPGNINVDPPVCGGCWWLTDTWMNHCPRGFSHAKCMTEQRPIAVGSEIIRFLSDSPHLASRLSGTAARTGAARFAIAGSHDLVTPNGVDGSAVPKG